MRILPVRLALAVAILLGIAGEASASQIAAATSPSPHLIEMVRPSPGYLATLTLYGVPPSELLVPIVPPSIDLRVQFDFPIYDTVFSVVSLPTVVPCGTPNGPACIDTAPIPEPSAALLFGIGLAVTAAARRR